MMCFTDAAIGHGAGSPTSLGKYQAERGTAGWMQTDQRERWLRNKPQEDPGIMDSEPSPERQC